MLKQFPKAILLPPYWLGLSPVYHAVNVRQRWLQFWCNIGFSLRVAPRYVMQQFFGTFTETEARFNSCHTDVLIDLRSGKRKISASTHWWGHLLSGWAFRWNLNSSCPQHWDFQSVLLYFSVSWNVLRTSPVNKGLRHRLWEPYRKWGGLWTSSLTSIGRPPVSQVSCASNWANMHIF